MLNVVRNVLLLIGEAKVSPPDGTEIVGLWNVHTNGIALIEWDVVPVTVTVFVGVEPTPSRIKFFVPVFVIVYCVFDVMMIE